MKFLQSKGAPTRMLYLRSRFLDVFMESLKDKEQSRKIYADALRITATTLSKADQKEALTVSREYFPFWMDDIKAITTFEKKYGFNTHSN